LRRSGGGLTSSSEICLPRNRKGGRGRGAQVGLSNSYGPPAGTEKHRKVITLSTGEHTKSHRRHFEEKMGGITGKGFLASV